MRQLSKRLFASLDVAILLAGALCLCQAALGQTQQSTPTKQTLLQANTSADDDLQKAEYYVVQGSKHNELESYVPGNSILGGKNYAFARGLFQSAAQKATMKDNKALLARILSERGWFVYRTSGQSEQLEAIKMLKQALSLNPKDAGLYTKLAATETDAYYEGHRKDAAALDRAKGYVRQSLILSPNQAASYFIRAALLAEQGNHLKQVGENYTNYVKYARHIDPELYLYDRKLIRNRLEIARNFGREFAPAEFKKLSPSIVSDSVAAVDKVIRRVGQQAKIRTLDDDNAHPPLQ